MPATDRWTARPRLAALVECLAVAVPVVVAAGVGTAVVAAGPDVSSVPRRLAWLVVPLTSAALTYVVVEGSLRRLAPLASVLRLSLRFPSTAPTRGSVARAAGSPRRLERRIDRVAWAGLPEDDGEAARAALAIAVGAHHHHPHLRGHPLRMARVADAVAAEMGRSEEERDRLRWAALVADFGKLTLPLRVLRKHGAPTRTEWQLLRAHPSRSLEITRPLAGWLGGALAAIEQHHERVDGLGYPLALAGSEIAPSATILSVADAYVAMTSPRPWRPALSPEAARDEIAEGAGSQFDPVVAGAALLALEARRGDRRRPIRDRVAVAPAFAATAGIVVVVAGAWAVGLGGAGQSAGEPDVLGVTERSGPPTRGAPVDNAAPIARDDEATTALGVPVVVAVLDDDEDPDGDELEVVAIDTTGTAGSAEIVEAGTGLRYHPRVAGADELGYTVSDGRGGEATAVLRVLVTE